jgi:hypothetical protein
MTAPGAKRPFIRKQHPVTDQLESGSGRGHLTVPSGEPRHQCFGGICEHRGVRRSCFHPVRAERRRSVGDQCDVIPNPPGGCVAEYRAISQIRRDVGRRGIRTIVSIAMASWGIACSTDRKNRVLRVPATKLVNPLGSVCRGFLWRGIVGSRWPSRPNFSSISAQARCPEDRDRVAQSAVAGCVSNLASSRPPGGNGRSIAEINEN